MMRYTIAIFFGVSVMLPLLAQDFSEGEGDFSLETPEVKATLNPFEPEVAEQELADGLDRAKANFLLSTGLEYADEGEYEEAEHAYLRALAEAPDDSSIRFRLSTLYINMDRYPEAVALLETLIKEHPESAIMHNNLSWCYATGTGVKNKEKALLHAREAILSSPMTASVWNTLAEAYYVAGDYEKALRSAEHALSLLMETNPSEETAKSYLAQRERIILSQKALKMFEGLDDEE